MARDPEYAEKIHRKKDEQNKARSARRKAEREALLERARTDPEAVAELEAIRAKQRAASERSRQKKLARMKADPELATESAKENETSGELREEVFDELSSGERGQEHRLTELCDQ